MVLIYTTNRSGPPPQVQKYGELDELTIFYHRRTGKHLGLGRAVFQQVAAARLCTERLHHTSVMGKVLSVFLDAFGELPGERAGGEVGGGGARWGGD